MHRKRLISFVQFSCSSLLTRARILTNPKQHATKDSRDIIEKETEFTEAPTSAKEQRESRERIKIRENIRRREIYFCQKRKREK